MELKALDINSVGDYGVSSSDKKREISDGKEGGTCTVLEDDVLIQDIFKDETITNLVDLSMLLKRKKDLDYNEYKRSYNDTNNKVQELKGKIHFSVEDANTVIRQLKRGRLKFKQLSDLLYLHDILPNEGTKKIVDYIRDNNITVIAYKRLYTDEIYCFCADGDNIEDANFDLLKYINIKNYTHGTWADINDLRRAGRYNNRKEYGDNLNNEGKKVFKPDYRAWMNSKNLDIGYEEDNNQKNDIYVLNSNHPHNNIISTPSIKGMMDRGEKSAIVFNHLLKKIDDYSNELFIKGKPKIQKNIILTGVSNGNIHMLKSCKHFNCNNLEDNDKINIHLESIPHYGIFTANPLVDTPKFFVDAVLSNGDVYDKVEKIKIETNLSKNFHPYSAVYDFLRGVYNYYIYDNNIPIEQMEDFYNKLHIQDKLKAKSDEIYKEAIRKKKRKLLSSDREVLKDTELQGIVLFVYLCACLTFIGAFFYYVMKRWQKYRNDKRYLNKIYVSKKNYNKNNKIIQDGNNNNLSNQTPYSQRLFEY